MSSLALRKNIRPVNDAAAISARRLSPARPADKSLEGVLLFSGMGFALIVLAAIFSYLRLPPPVF